jgi:hypothetical protein
MQEVSVDFASFYDFDIWFWNCSDGVVFFSHFTDAVSTNLYTIHFRNYCKLWVFCPSKFNHSNDIIIIPVVVLTTIHKNIDLIHQMAIYALIFLCGSRHKKIKRLTHILPTLDIWHSKWYVSKNALTLKWSCIIQDVRYTHDISLQLIFFCHWKSADIKCLFPKLSRK